MSIYNYRNQVHPQSRSSPSFQFHYPGSGVLAKFSLTSLDSMVKYTAKGLERVWGNTLGCPPDVQPRLKCVILAHPTLTSQLTCLGMGSSWPCGCSGGRRGRGRGDGRQGHEVLGGSTAHLLTICAPNNNPICYSFRPKVKYTEWERAWGHALDSQPELQCVHWRIL